MDDAFEKSFEQFANKKQSIINNLIDSHEERIIGSLKALRTILLVN
jgi:hypothetical protein